MSMNQCLRTAWPEMARRNHLLLVFVMRKSAGGTLSATFSTRFKPVFVIVGVVHNLKKCGLRCPAMNYHEQGQAMA